MHSFARTVSCVTPALPITRHILGEAVQIRRRKGSGKMANRLAVALAIALIAAGMGASYTANAEGRGLSNAGSPAAACDRQHWPSYAAQCLSKLDGTRSDRLYRVVAAF
jgi:hypothetical protein